MREADCHARHHRGPRINATCMTAVQGAQDADKFFKCFACSLDGLGLLLLNETVELGSSRVVEYSEHVLAALRSDGDGLGAAGRRRQVSDQLAEDAAVRVVRDELLA